MTQGGIVKQLMRAVLTGKAQRVDRRPTNQKVTGSILVRAHVRDVAGYVPDWGHARDNLSMFLSLSFSLPSPFSKSK